MRSRALAAIVPLVLSALLGAAVVIHPASACSASFRSAGCATLDAIPSTLPGCADWPATKYLQVPWTRQANGGTGVANQNGSFFGQGFHQGCNIPTAMNQQYALDFGLQLGDAVVAPGGAGRVVYAGVTRGAWSTCGNTVVVDHGGGWWSLVCHLSQVYVGTGQLIGSGTVIGLVGGTGGFVPHLHFSLMHNANIVLAMGGVYGGQSAQPHHMHHVSGGGGYYETFTQGMSMSY